MEAGWQRLRAPLYIRCPERLVEEHVPGNSDVVYHVYTADDERYYTYTEHGTAPVEWHFTIRDLGGNVLRDFQKSNTTWSVFRDYVYRDGTLLASLTSSAAQHISVDHLGSPRIFTSDSAVRIGAHTFVPYGTEWSDGSAQEGDVRKFTGHERDKSFVSTESFGLDYMKARFYSPNLGRFLSIDKIGGHGLVPQSWDRYTYASDKPLAIVDPTGLYPCDVVTPKGLLIVECVDGSSAPVEYDRDLGQILYDTLLAIEGRIAMIQERAAQQQNDFLIGSLPFQHENYVECYAARDCKSFNEYLDEMGPMVGGEFNAAKIAKLDLIADDLIRGIAKSICVIPC